MRRSSAWIGPTCWRSQKKTPRKAGVADRYSTIPGSAFDVDFGSGYDIVLVPNFLHHFDPATNEKLLRKVHAALAPGGIVIAPEFIPNEDRISPPRDAMFSMQMLGTPAGDAYTYSELENMFRNAGFARSEMRELAAVPATPGSVVQVGSKSLDQQTGFRKSEAPPGADAASAS